MLVSIIIVVILNQKKKKQNVFSLKLRGISGRATCKCSRKDRGLWDFLTGEVQQPSVMLEGMIYVVINLNVGNGRL